MEKQRIFFARNKKHAESIANRLLDKEGRFTHNIKSLHMQEPTVRMLVLETCPRKTLTLCEDLVFRMK